MASVGRRSFGYIDCTHRTKLQVVHKCIQRLFLLAFRRRIEFCNDLDGRIGTSQLTSSTARTGMFIMSVMDHDHFPAGNRSGSFISSLFIRVHCCVDDLLSLQ